MVPFNYLVPALFWNATVLQVQNLGNISTGGSQLLGQVIKARLYSEPGVCCSVQRIDLIVAPISIPCDLPFLSGTTQFEPCFSADFLYGEDYVTADPGVDGIARPNLIGVVAPDNGDTPFIMQVSGIQVGTPVLDEITGTNTSIGQAVPYGAAYSGMYNMHQSQIRFFEVPLRMENILGCNH
ncbi:hypothetical protein MMC34_003281 [Xylographa carneopallida]|nr:hypothetical protein [Xylographa carneopallida]